MRVIVVACVQAADLPGLRGSGVRGQPGGGTGGVGGDVTALVGNVPSVRCHSVGAGPHRTLSVNISPLPVPVSFPVRGPLSHWIPCPTNPHSPSPKSPGRTWKARAGRKTSAGLSFAGRRVVSHAAVRVRAAAPPLPVQPLLPRMEESHRPVITGINHTAANTANRSAL